MNTIAATISDIQSVDTVNIVGFDVAGQAMQMMALELSERVGVGSKVMLGVKATNVTIAKEIRGQLSISNQLEVRIEKVDLGALLCSVKFTFKGQLWESVITRESALAMELESGDKVMALIKSSELSIVEVL